MLTTLVRKSSSLARIACACAALTCAPHVARAQPTPDSSADALFRAGRAAALAGDAQTACAKLRESYRLEAAPGTLLNIALCERALGELHAAMRHCQEVLQWLPDDDDRRPIARELLQALEAQVPTLALQLAVDAPPETQVRLGARELGSASLGTALRLDPGEHEIEVRAPGHQPHVQRVQLKAGDRVTLTLEVGPLDRAPLPSSVAAAASLPVQTPTQTAGDARDDDASGSAQRITGIVLLGVGGASLVASAITGGLALDRLATVDEDCSRKTASCETNAGIDAAREGNTFYVASLVTLGVAVVSAGVGTYLLLTAPDDDDGVSVIPAITPHAALLVTTTRF